MTITLRPYLTGSLNDLVESANLGQLGKSSLVCELVALFVDYEDEGAALFLDVFLADDLAGLTAAIPSSACLKLGTAPCDEAGIRKAVKKTAPLVRGCWKMFITPNGADIEFGLFRDSGHPLNVPLDLALVPGGAGGPKYIRVTKLAHETVRTSTHAGTTAVMHFTNAKSSASGDQSSLNELCAIICSGLKGNLAGSTRTYLESLLSNALRASHGALIAVTKGRLPKFLSDCTRTDPEISVSAAVDAVLKDPAAIPQLAAAESIVFGMLASDGIVVFDTKANVVAYNAFIKLKASNVSGGARRRAFSALSERVGQGIVAAYFLSQDGSSELKKEKT